MKSLTPDKALSGECGFMAANLYAKSIFGEDALANVSLEKNPAKPDATVTGHIRIRAKSQGKYTVGSKDFRVALVRRLTAATTLAFLFVEMLCYVLGRLYSSCVLCTKIGLHR